MFLCHNFKSCTSHAGGGNCSYGLSWRIGVAWRNALRRFRRVFHAISFHVFDASSVRNLSVKEVRLLRQMFRCHSSILKLPLLFALPEPIGREATRLGISPERCMALWRFHLELVNDEQENGNE